MSLLLRNGVSFGDATKLLKQAYIEEAEQDLKTSGEKTTTSRIAIITGLTRKDVGALRKESSPKDHRSEQHNRAIRVISGWSGDSHFCNEEGNAKVLKIKGSSESFESLVNKYSGDMPYRAMLSELLRTGAVEKIGNDDVVLVRSAYVSSDDENEKYTILGEDVSLLIKTIKHNISTAREDAYYQRKVQYDNIPRESVDDFKTLANRENQLLLLKLNTWLIQHDLDNTKQKINKETVKVGVGIYYFEEPTESSEDINNDD